ncbi:MAG: hypothetical protein ACK55I_13365, partial [bacterium]
RIVSTSVRAASGAEAGMEGVLIAEGRSADSMADPMGKRMEPIQFRSLAWLDHGQRRGNGRQRFKPTEGSSEGGEHSPKNRR